MTVRRMSASLIVVTASLPLAACFSFGAKPPKQLLTLSAVAQPQPGAVQSSATARAIVVQVPSVPQAISTVRVPVQAPKCTRGSIITHAHDARAPTW